MFCNPKLIIALALSFTGASLFAQPAANPSAARTLVRAGHLLDVKTGKLLDNETIFVVGDSIQSIAATASVPAQPADTVIDLGGLTVLPGLIDVHTHLTGNPDFDPYRELASTNAKETWTPISSIRSCAAKPSSHSFICSLLGIMSASIFFCCSAACLSAYFSNSSHAFFESTAACSSAALRIAAISDSDAFTFAACCRSWSPW